MLGRAAHTDSPADNAEEDVRGVGEAYGMALRAGRVLYDICWLSDTE